MIIASYAGLDIPYPSPADRKDLENLIKSNWNAYVQAPITHTAEGVSESVGGVKDWIFDSYALLNHSPSVQC